MQEYYFLFALALVYTIFAVMQDFKQREVANWLNFSLAAFALAYRAFYSLKTEDYHFFLFGILGIVAFALLSHAFYYAKAFAGGDAKLLIAFGAIIPFSSYFQLLTLSLAFVFVLFLSGTIYSLIYSVFVMSTNKKQFKKEFSVHYKKHKTLFISSIVLTAISITLWTISFGFITLTIACLLPSLYVYTLSLDKCMIKLTPPSKLTEGDWLEKDVKIGSKTIKKTVHGLSLEEIKFLQKHSRSVLIKQGIPFTPAFLITLLVLIYTYIFIPELILNIFSLFSI